MGKKKRLEFEFELRISFPTAKIITLDDHFFFYLGINLIKAQCINQYLLVASFFV